MSTVDYGDYTITTTVTANGRTQQVQWKPGTQGANVVTLLQRAQTALTNNQTFLAIASPTQAQAVAQVQALTRQVDGLIRFLLGTFDTITDS
jgi:hypothetical protein